MTDTSNSAGQLKAFIERIERLSEEAKTISEDIRDVYAEAKSTGFEVKILRKVIALRKKGEQARREEDEILSLYMQQIGMEF